MTRQPNTVGREARASVPLVISRTREGLARYRRELDAQAFSSPLLREYLDRIGGDA